MISFLCVYILLSGLNVFRCQIRSLACRVFCGKKKRKERELHSLMYVLMGFIITLKSPTNDVRGTQLHTQLSQSEVERSSCSLDHTRVTAGMLVKSCRNQFCWWDGGWFVKPGYFLLHIFVCRLLGVCSPA